MVSPKQVRRGGKYTTGIKRTKSGGYGGQTTGRRGCLSMVVVVGLMVSLVALAACDPEPASKQGQPAQRPAPSRTVPEVKQGNVNALCDAVKAYDGSADQRANIAVKAEMSGIPDSLKRKGVAFSRAADADGARLVLLECATLGWRG